ncbi:MAG: hypothetical protein KME29_10715 [Calothrix sp. FI2-JRJ7]|jgi:hypothetical protein|nr:hypothetical protein [Calothrix sp. FI2-JRJ7]MBW4600056.1 hypothetical protein [Calothrix sp. FI2-JRJ7]
MSTQYGQKYPNACVFTVPITLNIPIQLQPEVYSAPQVCVTQNGYSKQQQPAPLPQPKY